MEVRIRPAREEDAEAISGVIVAALRVSNAKDYPPAVNARVAAGFSAPAVRALLARRRVFVATVGGAVVGTAGLEGQVVRSVFVDPAWQGRGVGRALMARIDRVAAEAGVGRLRVPASVTAEAFYARLGFVVVREKQEGEERIIVMERAPRPAPAE